MATSFSTIVGNTEEKLRSLNPSIMLLSEEDTDSYTPLNIYPYFENFKDETYSTINEKTKVVTVDPSQINITQEQNSQYIPFKIPRYWDGIDLKDMVISIYYINANNQSGQGCIINGFYNENYIIFGWLIDEYVTQKAGNIKFEIRATGTVKDVDGNVKKYVWISKSNNSLSVLQSLAATGGPITPDESWVTSFENKILNLTAELDERISKVEQIDANVTEQIKAAQTAAQDAQAAADQALDTLEDLNTAKLNAIAEIEASVSESIENKLDTYATKDDLNNYYTKEELGNLFLEDNEDNLNYLLGKETVDNG